MPTKNSTGTGKAGGKSGTVAKPKKLAVKKETIAAAGSSAEHVIATQYNTCAKTCGCPPTD